MGVVWSVEHYKYYLKGKHFQILTDHQALLSALRENRGNKTYQSRLTRWADRLLQFDYEIDLLPGTKMGLIDQLSRQPNSNERSGKSVEDDERYVIACIQNQIDLCFGNQGNFNINS